MERSVLADKILSEILKTGHEPSLVSTIAFETKTHPATTLSVITRMAEIHPGWYSIQRRCKTDIEVRVDFYMLPQVAQFLSSGGYSSHCPNRFQAVTKTLPYRPVKQVRMAQKIKWIRLAAVIMSLLCVAITWYIIRH